MRIEGNHLKGVRSFIKRSHLFAPLWFVGESLAQPADVTHYSTIRTAYVYLVILYYFWTKCSQSLSLQYELLNATLLVSIINF